jgi:hypothetical protein
MCDFFRRGRLHSMLLLVGLAYESGGTSIVFSNGLLGYDQLRDLDSIIRGSRTNIVISK